MAPKKEKKEAAETAAAAPADGTKAPKKPDEAYFAKCAEEIDAKIKVKQEEIKKISAQIDQKTEGKQEYEAEKNAIFEQMQKVMEEKTALKDAKKKLKDAAIEQKQAQRANQKTLKGLEKDVAGLTEESIDAQIGQIEYKMATQSLTLKEEKAMLMQIKKLKAERPKAAKQLKEYEEMKAKCDSSAVVDTTQSMEEQVKELDAKIEEKGLAHQELYEKKKALQTVRDSKTGNVKDLIEKKKAVKTDVDALYAEKKALFDEKRAQTQAYNAYDKELRLARQKAQQEARDAEWAVWQAEQAKRELEKPNPYVEETTLIEQTIDYCKGLLPKEEAPEAEAKKELVFEGAAGGKLMLSKKDREKEMYFAPTKKKALKKKGGDDKKKAIKHTAETFQIFEKLKLPAPLSTDDLPGLVEKLQASLAGYMVKVAEWEAERKAKLEAAAKEEETPKEE